MPADILGIRPELHGPGAAAQTRTVSGAIFGRAKRQLSRDLKYIAQTLLKLSFLSSSPTWPARESGLCGIISGCVRTADVPDGCCHRGCRVVVSWCNHCHRSFRSKPDHSWPL